MRRKISYGHAIREGFAYLLQEYPEVFAFGQGLWSPWYVGNTMTDLEKEFGKERIIDTPVSELACTGVAIGASLNGFRPIVIHPRMDFMLLAIDQIVNQAAKWCHMFGGQASPSVTIRGIINRGGEQGAQHSQALHAWFAHIPGLRVVMPSTVQDARDLLIASVLCNDPVLYIDDRWLYDREDEIGAIEVIDLAQAAAAIMKCKGNDITLVGTGYSAYLCELAAAEMKVDSIIAEVFDLRILNPMDTSAIANSVKKTGRLLVVDGGWKTAGIAGEVIARVTETIPSHYFKTQPTRITLPDSPAPTSKNLEKSYYFSVDTIISKAKQIFLA